MDDTDERRGIFLQWMEQVNLTAGIMQQKSPKEIIAEGVRESTRFTDEKVVEQLSEKAINGEMYIKENNYDVFLFGIAESLENTRCGTTSQNEYFGWIDEGKRIIRSMTDGFVSYQDIHKRDDFIKFSLQREAEILTCLGLYEKSNHPKAKKRYSELLIKLQRLRQIRSAILAGTKNKSDQRPLTAKERARLYKYIDALDDMQEYDSNGDYFNLLLLQRLSALGISHMDDAEFFYGGYSFYERLKAEQKRIEEEKQLENQLRNEILNNSDDYLFLAKFRKDTREYVRRRIVELSGRRLVFHKHPPVLARRLNLRVFSAQRYQRLREQF